MRSMVQSSASCHQPLVTAPKCCSATFSAMYNSTCPRTVHRGGDCRGKGRLVGGE
jgi:hypothetical protein